MEASILHDESKVHSDDWLNTHLCRTASHCKSLDEVLEIATTLLSSQEQPISSDVAIPIVLKFWHDIQTGRVVPMTETGGSDRISDLFGLVMGLAHADPQHVGDATALYIVITKNHATRCRRGETFSITPKAMAMAQVIPGWSWERYDKAKKLLTVTGFLVLVSPFKPNKSGREAAQYKLANPSQVIIPEKVTEAPPKKARQAEPKRTGKDEGVKLTVVKTEDPTPKKDLPDALSDCILDARFKSCVDKVEAVILPGENLNEVMRFMIKIKMGQLGLAGHSLDMAKIPDDICSIFERAGLLKEIPEPSPLSRLPPEEPHEFLDELF